MLRQNLQSQPWPFPARPPTLPTLSAEAFFGFHYNQSVATSPSHQPLAQPQASLSRLLQKPLHWSPCFHESHPTGYFRYNKRSEPSYCSSSQTLLPAPSCGPGPPCLSSHPHALPCSGWKGAGRSRALGLCIGLSYCPGTFPTQIHMPHSFKYLLKYSPLRGY